MSQQTDSTVHDVENFLKESNYAGLREFCLSEGSQKRVCESGWEILSVLMNHIKNMMVTAPDQCILQELFDHIARVSNAKELLLGILEQLDPMVELEIVEMLLPPLQIVLEKLMHSDLKHHCYNLSMVFSSLLYYGESLNIPNYEHFDPTEDQKELMEELKIARFTVKCSEIVSMALQIVKMQLSEEVIHRTHMKAVEDEIMLFLCGLMERISLLNIIHQSQDEKQEVYQIEKAARSVVLLIISLHSAWDMWHNRTWKNYNPNDRKMSEEEHKKIASARACTLYMLSHDENLTHKVVQVMNSRFSFVCAIPSVLALLESQNPTSVHKGLALCRFVSNRLEPLCLQCSFLAEELKIVPIQHPARCLLNAAVAITLHCPVKVLRQRAAQFLTKVIDKFVWKDRFSLFHHLISTVEHSGVVGYMTVYYKDKLAEILTDEPPDGSEVFLKRNNFDAILEACTALPSGSETDLLAEYDRIMASLNLLRFLFLRDVDNKTGVWDKTSALESRFLNPLRTGINLSRMHFRDEMKKQSLPNKDQQAGAPEFTINGLSLPSLSPEHRVQMLLSAVHSFDMMQAVCVRVQEVMDKR